MFDSFPALVQSRRFWMRWKIARYASALSLIAHSLSVKILISLSHWEIECTSLKGLWGCVHDSLIHVHTARINPVKRETNEWRPRLCFSNSFLQIATIEAQASSFRSFETEVLWGRDLHHFSETLRLWLYPSIIGRWIRTLMPPIRGARRHVWCNTVWGDD